MSLHNGHHEEKATMKVYLRNAAITAASAFLVSQGKLDTVLNDYSGSATPKFAQMALDGGC